MLLFSSFSFPTPSMYVWGHFLIRIFMSDCLFWPSTLYLSCCEDSCESFHICDYLPVCFFFLSELRPQILFIEKVKTVCHDPNIPLLLQLWGTCLTKILWFKIFRKTLLSFARAFQKNIHLYVPFCLLEIVIWTFRDFLNLPFLTQKFLFAPTENLFYTYIFFITYLFV